MSVSYILSGFSTWFFRLLRGFILFFWIVILAVISFYSLKGSLADSMLSDDLETDFRHLDPSSLFKNYFTDKDDKGRVECPSGTALITLASRYREAPPPPLETIIGKLLPNFDWAHALQPEGGLCNLDDIKKLYKSYVELSNRFEKSLRSLAKNEPEDTKTAFLDPAILLAEFKGKVEIPEARVAELSPETQDWIAEEKIRIEKEKKANALLGAFFLLSALGALGALIFLIRDYTYSVNDNKLRVYIFQPILGIFLAVAVFIVDILAHSVISTASVLEIRYEPLYILALGAGLMSEKAYDAIRRRADSAFDQYAKKDSENETASTDA